MMMSAATRIRTSVMRFPLQAARLSSLNRSTLRPQYSFSTRSTTISNSPTKTLSIKGSGTAGDVAYKSRLEGGLAQSRSTSTSLGTNSCRTLEAEHNFAFDSGRADHDFIKAFVKRCYAKCASFQRMPTLHISDE